MLAYNTALSQYKHLVIIPVLTRMGVMTANLASLVAAIGHQESAYDLIAQMNGGPARGYWQMEPFTHDDCWQNYLRYPRQSKMATALRGMVPPDAVLSDQLVSNTAYAAGMCAVKCLRAPTAIPDNAQAQANFWKRFYNTAQGAGTVSPETVAVFRAALSA